jgi:predicted PurR-regulated permease PerM
MRMAEARPSADSPDPAAVAALAEALRARLELAELRAQVAALRPRPVAAPIPPAARLHLTDIQAIRDALVVACVLGLLWLGYKLSVVTVPILLAMLLAYLFEPLIRRMVQTRWFSRPGAALLVIFTTLLLVVVPAALGLGTAVVQGAQLAGGVARTTNNVLAVRQFTEAAAEEGGKFGHVEIVNAGAPGETLAFRPAPENQPAQAAAERASAAFLALPRQVREGVTKLIKHRQELRQRAATVGADGPAAAKPPWWVSIVDLSVAWVQNNSEAVAEVGRSALGTGAEAVGVAVRTLTSVLHLGLTLVLTAFFFYFFSTGYGRVLAFWERLIPERRKSRVIGLIERMDRVIAGFVRGRLTIGAILMVMYTAGYWAIGVPAPLVLGPIVGALALVPFMTVPAIPLAMLLMALEPSGIPWQQSWGWIIGAPIGMYVLEKILDDYILTPAIQGKHTEMSVPAILFASLAGGVLAGVYGLLIAIPVAACLNILMKEVFWPRFAQWAQGERQDFLPISRGGDGETPVSLN